MVGSRRVVTTLALIVCVFTLQSNVAVFAAEAPSDGTAIPVGTPLTTFTPLTASGPFDLNAQAARVLPSAPFTFLTPEFGTASAQIFRGDPYPYRHRRHDGSLAAVMIGAAAAITGTALIVYANRPECSVNQNNAGCGYGMKVIGTSVLTGGFVSIMVGALTWR